MLRTHSCTASGLAKNTPPSHPPLPILEYPIVLLVRPVNPDSRYPFHLALLTDLRGHAGLDPCASLIVSPGLGPHLSMRLDQCAPSGRNAEPKRWRAWMTDAYRTARASLLLSSPSLRRSSCVSRRALFLTIDEGA